MLSQTQFMRKFISTEYANELKRMKAFKLFIEWETFYWVYRASVWRKSRLVRECKEYLRTFRPDRSRPCWVSYQFGKLGSLSDLLICHPYGLISGWIREEEQRSWENGLDCYMSRCLWPAIDSVRTGWLLGFDKPKPLIKLLWPMK